jgi:hypothetical protein
MLTEIEIFGERENVSCCAAASLCHLAASGRAHPNYWIVTGEMAVVPVAPGLPVYALLFLCLNWFVLNVRIRAENHALAWASEKSGGTPRER